MLSSHAGQIGPDPMLDRSILTIVARFPSTFGLRGHAGLFRVSVMDSYWRDETTLALCVQKLSDEGTWNAFTTAGERELAHEIVKLGGEP